MEFDKRRRQYVPLDVFVAFDDFGTALLEKWGMEGLCAWVLFLAACKREPVQGTFTYTTDEEGWGKLGATATRFPIGELFTFTGHWKKTSKRRQGRITYVQVTPKLWEKWNTTTRQKPSTHPQNRSSLHAESKPITAGEVEVEGEDEKNGRAHAPRRTSTLSWQPAHGSKDPGADISRQITNGALTTTHDLDVELRAANINGPEADVLRAQLEAA